DTLASMGCRVEPVLIPGLQRRDFNSLSSTLFAAETTAYFETLIRNRTEELHPVLKDRLTSNHYSLTSYLNAQRNVEELRNDLATYFSRYDLLLCPVTPVAAHPRNASELW